MKNKTDLLNPTPAQVKHRNRLWVNALLENKRKARKEMHDKDGGRCCLAVAQDVAIACGVLDSSLRKENSTFPHESVCEFFGWGTNNPKLKVKINGKFNIEVAAALNDGVEIIGSFIVEDHKIVEKGLSHKQIAECVLNTFVHPSKPKQSFKIEVKSLPKTLL